MGNFSQSGLIGKPLKQMYIKTKFNAVISAAGLNSIRFHDLRHTFATLLYMAGVDVMAARDQLGHANIGTTLSIYTHLSQKYKEKNIDKLNEYLDKISNL